MINRYYEWEELCTHYGLLFVEVTEPRRGTVVTGPFAGSFSECALKGVFIPAGMRSLDCEWVAEKMGLRSFGDAGPIVRMICAVLDIPEPSNLVNRDRMGVFDPSMP